MSLITSLAKTLNLRENDVSQFLLEAPRKYKVYTIPKRTKGVRVIAQPSKSLKSFQRTFLELYEFPTHPCSMAYQVGKSIKENAFLHKDNTFFLKMDFENFFNSIKPSMVFDSLNKTNCPNSEQDIRYLERLLFWQPSKRKPNNLVLSIGAPSSPTLSNLCMYDFDVQIATLCAGKGITYTRYADDLTFSTKERGALFSTPDDVSDLLLTLFNKAIIINRSKTFFSSKAHNRHVTGVTINNEDELSLGRKRKRYIKHLVHQYILNRLNEDDIRHLQGLLSFAKHIEPVFIARLSKKYTVAVIEKIIETKV